MIKNALLILIGKLLSKFIKTFNLGNGSTWPGHIALMINPHFIRDMLASSKAKTIIVSGTNGKTTTASMIRSILETDGERVIQNMSGANLLNGIASTLLLRSSILSTQKYEYAIFEVDENSLPLLLKEFHPDVLVLLNLFRDQLDRYGEVRTIASKWKKAIGQLTNKTTLILNADDPEVSYLGKKAQTKTSYFGLNDKSISKPSLEHAVDSVYCPNCAKKLSYKEIYFSHLGNWFCESCQLKRPILSLESFDIYPLLGIYNRYNTLASVLTTQRLNVKHTIMASALQEGKPAFGRQERIQIGNKFVQIFLSKNPASFNQSLQTVMEKKPKAILFVLNDRIPDGRDISWIWDTNIEELANKKIDIVVSGDRAYDMGLRLKYASSSKYPISNIQFQISNNLENAITNGLKSLSEQETLYVLPTYSAMLEIRKILTGKKIL